MKGAVLITSDVGLNVIVVGEEIVYVPVAELGALMLAATMVPAVNVPDTFNESLMVMAEDSDDEITVTSMVFGTLCR